MGALNFCAQAVAENQSGRYSVEVKQVNSM